MKCPNCQLEHEWYYYDHKTKRDILSDDVPALLRVARAVQHRRMRDLTFDEIGKAQDEIEEALKEVEHLLEVDK